MWLIELMLTEVVGRYLLKKKKKEILQPPQLPIPTKFLYYSTLFLSSLEFNLLEIISCICFALV